MIDYDGIVKADGEQNAKLLRERAKDCDRTNFGCQFSYMLTNSALIIEQLTALSRFRKSEIDKLIIHDLTTQSNNTALTAKLEQAEAENKILRKSKYNRDYDYLHDYFAGLTRSAVDAYKTASKKAEQAEAELQRWHTSKIAPNVKNEFANTSTLCCHNCDHKDEYIEELERTPSIVYCKDCQYQLNAKGKSACDIYKEFGTNDFFCKHGKKKVGNI